MSVSPAFLTVCAGVNVPISLPSLSVTVTDPSFPTVTFASAGNLGFASFTAFLTASFSSSVKWDGSATSTGVVGALIFSITVSFCESCPTFLFSPSPCVTVTDPSFATVIVAPAGSVLLPLPSLLASSTAFFTAAFSSSVKFVLSTTSVFSGAFKAIILSSAVACLTVLAGSIVWFPADPIGTVTVPSSATLISSYVKSRSLLAAITASLTARFSASVSFAGFDTIVIAGSFNVLPALSNGFTVSLPSNLPVLVPSVTVTLPLLSTVTTASLLNLVLFASLTAAATLSLSSCVKLVVSFTSVFSGAVKSRIVSFCTTVWSGVNEPTLPPWLIFTDPSSFTVISSSVKFLSGLASLIASLTACFSLGVNFVLSSTLTGSIGGLNSFLTSFCFTVFSGVNVPVLPSFVTVTVPSSATVISSFVKLRSPLAFITASLTLSFSSVVSPFRSFTSTGVGSFNCNSSVAVFSQTAYTVLGALTLFKMLASASVASFVAAQPLNVYPSLVGSVGFVTFPPSTLAVLVSLPSANLPPLASNVTVVSSEYIA